MPFFRKTLLSPARMQINSGALQEAGAIFPKPDWQRVSEAEFAVLTGQGSKLELETGGSLPFGGSLHGPLLSLLELPCHIRERWWQVAEAVVDSSQGQSNSSVARGFFDAVLEFLSFKRAPLSRSCMAQIIVNSTGQRATGNFRELTASAYSAGPVGARPTPLFYAFNLGDEPVAIWFSSLARTADCALLTNSPFIRLSLSPGEGVAAWPPCMLIDGDTLAKGEPDLILRITPQAADAARGVV